MTHHPVLAALLVAATALPASAWADTGQTRFVEAGGVRYAHRVHGPETGTPLVLSQRFRGTMDDWDPAFIDALAQTRPVVVFDGAGVSSSSGEVPTTIAGMADDMATFVEALGNAEVDVLGWSMGGFVAQELATRHPEMVDRLILVGTGPAGSPETPAPEATVFEVATRPSYGAEEREHLFFADAPSSLARAKASMARIDAVRDPDAEPPTTPGMMQVQGAAIEAWLGGGDGAFERLPAIEAPTLIVAGDRDPFFPVLGAFLLHREIPDTRLAVHPMAGHAPHHQWPEQSPRPSTTSSPTRRRARRTSSAMPAGSFSNHHNPGHPGPEGVTPMNRRTMLRIGTAAALPILAAPFVRTAAAQEAAATGPTPRTTGTIDLGRRIKGYTVDSVRNHSINAYWVQGADGMLAVDAYWCTPEAREALGRMEAVTGRAPSDIRAVAITHPHTDHYGGLEPYRKAAPGAAVLATRAVARVIGNDEHGFYVNRLEDFGSTIPAEIPAVDPGIADGRPLEAGGAVLRPIVVRDSEAIETAMLYEPEARVLFTADVVNNKTTPVLYQGSIDAWIAQLRGLRALAPEAETIAPGHGAPGDFDTLVTEEIAYLTTFGDAVQAELWREGGAMPPEAVARIQTAMADAFPDWRTSAGVPSRGQLIALNVGWTLRGWRLGGAEEGGPEAFREE